MTPIWRKEVPSIILGIPSVLIQWKYEKQPNVNPIPVTHLRRPALPLAPIVLPRRTRDEWVSQHMDFIISAVLTFQRLPVTLASKLEPRNFPFDCKTHRGLLLTRLLFFHTQAAFLCKMCSGQMSNTN